MTDAELSEHLPRPFRDVNWQAVARLMEAHETAKQLGCMTGTSNWAAIIWGALAQPAEPVAWRVRDLDSKHWIIFQHYPVDAMNDPGREVQPLFAAQPAIKETT